MVRVFPAPIPGGALGPKAQGGGSSVPAGTAKGSGSRDCASWQPPAAQAPTDRSDSTATTTSTEGVHLDLFKMLGTLDPDVHRPGARPRGVRRWARTAGGRRATPPGTGCRPGRDRRPGTRCRRVGQRQRRRARIHARRAPGPTPGGTPPVRAGIVNRALGHGPGRSTVVVPEPARGRTALPDRRPWRRSGDSRRERVRTWRRWRCVGLLPPG